MSRMSFGVAILIILFLSLVVDCIVKICENIVIDLCSVHQANRGYSMPMPAFSGFLFFTAGYNLIMTVQPMFTGGGAGCPTTPGARAPGPVKLIIPTPITLAASQKFQLPMPRQTPRKSWYHCQPPASCPPLGVYSF